MTYLWVRSSGGASAPRPTGAPAGLGEVAADGTLRGCRTPRDRLTRVTGEQAGIMSDLSGCLVEGAFTSPAGQTGTDFVVEARGRSNYLFKNSGSRPSYDHATFSGLERDDAGEPVTLWDVKRLIESAAVITSSIVEWANDLVHIGSGTEIRDSTIAGHCDFVLDNGTRQHPDGMQADWLGGPVVIDGNTIDNDKIPLPARSDGAPVEVRSVLSASNSACRINDVTGKSIGRLTFTNNICRGGTGFMLSVLPTGESANWWDPVYTDGVLTAGVEFYGNTTTVASQYSDFQGPRSLYTAFKDRNVRAVDGTTGPWYSKSPWVSDR